MNCSNVQTDAAEPYLQNKIVRLAGYHAGRGQPETTLLRLCGATTRHKNEFVGVTTREDNSRILYTMAVRVSVSV